MSVCKGKKYLLGITDAQADDLRKTADYTNPNGELSYASLEQNINGVPVFQGEIKAGFNKRSEMFRVVNELAPGVDPATVSQDFGDPASAVRAAAANINVSDAKLDLAEILMRSDDLKVTFATVIGPLLPKKCISYRAGRRGPCLAGPDLGTERCVLRSGRCRFRNRALAEEHN